MRCVGFGKIYINGKAKKIKIFFFSIYFIDNLTVYDYRGVILRFFLSSVATLAYFIKMCLCYPLWFSICHLLIFCLQYRGLPYYTK